MTKKSENGRPRTNKWGTLHVSLPKKLISKIKEQADGDDRSISYHAARLIQRALGMESGSGSAVSD